MWETGTIVTLTNGQCHELDLLVDASFSNGTSQPLLLSLPSRPFARLRPPFNSKGNQKQKQKRKNQTQSEDGNACNVSEHFPIAIDGRVVGKEALWIVHPIGTITAQQGHDVAVDVSFESVGHPGIYLSIDEDGRVSCLKQSTENARNCVFHAKIADPINDQTQNYASSANANTSESVVRCKIQEPQHHPRARSTISNTIHNNNTVICDDSVCGSTSYQQNQIDGIDTGISGTSSDNNVGPLLSQEQILQFAMDGYLVLRNVVPRKLWQPAAACVFGALGRPGAVVHGGDGSNSGHHAAGKLDGRYTQTPQMRALLGADSTLAKCAAQLMGRRTDSNSNGNNNKKKKRVADLADVIEISQTSAQVALRFPERSLLGLQGVAVPEEDGLWANVKASCTIRGNNAEKQHVLYDDDEVVDGRQEKNKGDTTECARELQAKYLHELGVRWHIDGTRQRQYHGFTLLMGVALSNCGVVKMVEIDATAEDVVRPSELEGQLCVWPLSHWHLQGMGRMCDPKPVDYESLIKAGAPLKDYEYFDYLDSADVNSRARSMKYFDVAAVGAESKVRGSNDNKDNTNISSTFSMNSHDHCVEKNPATPICSSSPGGFGPVIVGMKAGDGVLLHCETAHAATPNFNPSKVRAMAYYRLRLLPRSTADDERPFRGDADRKKMRELYEWGMEYDRSLNSVDSTIEDTSCDMLTPSAIAAARQILMTLWPDLGGVSEVLSEYVDGMVYHDQIHKNKIDEESEGIEDVNEENKKAGLKLLKMCNLHPRSPF